MVTIRIDGVNAQVSNLKEIGFKSNFVDAYSEPELNVDSLVLYKDSKAQIDEWLLNNGSAIGIPTTITYGGKTLDYYIDLTDNPIFKTYSTEVKIKKRKGKDSFFEMADGLTFELLNSLGVNFQYSEIPYIIVRDNQVELGITLSLSIFVIAKEIIELIKQTAGLVAEITGSPLAPGLAVASAIKAVALAVYIAGLSILLISFISQLFELVFPKIRKLNACKVKNLIETGCEYLGYSFKSTILDSLNGLTILPVPLQKSNKSFFNFKENLLTNSFTKGYPTANDTTPTLGQLLRAMKLIFNCEVRVKNGVVEMETKQYFKSISQFSIKPCLNVQESRESSYSINSSEMWTRYYLHYLTDNTDMHTLDLFEPTDSEYGSKNTKFIASDLNLLKGLKDVQIPFALGVPKRKFNMVEGYAEELFTNINNLIGTNLGGKLNDRIGVLQISQQIFTTTKMLYIDVNGKQPSNYLDYISANSLYINWHSILEPAINGFKVWENVPVKVRDEDYYSIIDNNYAIINGVECEITDILHIPESKIATIGYLEPFNYNNKKIITFALDQ